MKMMMGGQKNDSEKKSLYRDHFTGNKVLFIKQLLT